MTDTMTVQRSCPTPLQLAESRWQGRAMRGSQPAMVALYESDQHPGYFHCEVTIGGETVETRRPVKASGVAQVLGWMLKPAGFTVEDLFWEAVRAWKPAPPKPAETSVVYFLAAGPFIKIGKGSGDATKRASELQTGCPYPITILATMPGGVREEKALHRRFARIRAHGEWFRAEDFLLNFIASIVDEA